MKILQINESDMSGGAACAAFRLHKQLPVVGIKSEMLVQQKESSLDSTIGPKSNQSKAIAHLRTSLDHLPKLLYRNRKSTIYHFQWLPDFLIKKIRAINPDVVHLHWICRGFVNIRTVARIKIPMIWTLHDMWPFTGGCHYPNDCERYKKSCGKCPQLGSKSENDFSRWTWRRKARLWKNLDLTLVAPSRWMKTRIRHSSLFRNKTVEVIPNGIDKNRFRPLDRKMARSFLDFPKKKHLILFGALNATSDRRKGFQYLTPCLQRLSQTKTSSEVELIVFGASKPTNPPDFGFKTTYMGRLQDEISISMVYAACDVFIAPSVEDNLPNTVMEAMACGTPCVAFNIGGVPEMVDHLKNGYLAAPQDPDDLARGIAWVLDNENRRISLCKQAREKVETSYDISSMAKQMAYLYESVSR
jgi:glycosyltransferase involved in cell wall biosynthesis